MGKWITFDISDGTSQRLLLVVFYFAHMVLFCVYNVFGGCRVMSKCKGGG